MTAPATLDDLQLALPPSPYRGLVPFDDTRTDARFFVGRERETELVAANLLAARLTVLYGASGVGKSSLLRAGVAQHLREQAGSPPEHVVVVVSAWRDDACRAIESAVAAAVREHGGGPFEPEGRLADVLAAATDRLDADILLVLDQIDEYFLYHGSIGGLEDELPDVVNDPELRANVLLGVREDALAQLDAFKARVPQLFTNYFRLAHLDRASARRAIVEPLERYAAAGGSAVAAEPALVEAILDEVTVGRIQPLGPGDPRVGSAAPGHVEAPYLQLVLERLWNAERTAGSDVLRLQTLWRLGGAERIVREHLERALDRLSSAQKDVAAMVFPHLVTPARTKVAQSIEDLAQWARVDAAELAAAVAVLLAERILRPLAPGRSGRRRYELFHDVLAGAALQFSIRRRQELAVAAERARARQRHRRLAAALVLALAVSAAMAVVAAYALSQRADAREQARTARAQALTAAASAELPFNPELSLFLAAEATRLRPSESADEVLRRAYLDTSVRRVLRADAAVVAAGVGRSGIVTVDRGGAVRRWNVDGTLLTTARAGPGAAVAAIAPGGTVAVGAGRRVVVDEPSARWSLPLRAPARALALDAAAARLAVAIGAHVDVYDVAARRRTGTFTAGSPVSSVSFGPAGELVVTAAHEAIVLRGTLVALRVRDRAGVWDAALSPDGLFLATASSDGAGRVWNADDGTLTRELHGHLHEVTSVSWSGDGKWIATGSPDRSARVWRAEDGYLGATLLGHRGAVTSAEFVAGGELVVTGSTDGTARVWEPATRQQLRPLAHLGAAAIDVGWLAGGAVLATAETGTAVFAAGGTPARTARIHAGPLTDAAVDPTGRYAALATGSRVEIRRPPRAEVAAVLRHPATVVSVAFGGPDRLVTAARDDRVRVWTRSGRLLRTIEVERHVAAAALSRDGRLVAAATGRTAVVWEASSGRVQARLGGHAGDLTDLAFSPAGTRLVTTSVDRDARLWRARTGERLRVLRGHFGTVFSASFSPDGRWIVTAGPGSGGLWRADTGRLLLYLRGHTKPLAAARFDASGRWIATAGRDGDMRLYRCDVCAPTATLLKLARLRLATAGRALTPAERRRYLDAA